MIDWVKLGEDAGASVFNWANAIRVSMGLGGGVGVIKLLAHIPAPRLGGNWFIGSAFDVAADLLSNGRIGERRNKDGSVVYVIKPPRPKVPPDLVGEVVTYEAEPGDKPRDKPADKPDDEKSHQIIRPTGLN